MKKAFLFPGTGEGEKSIWFPWLKDELKKAKYQLKILDFPHNCAPNLADSLSYALRKVLPQSDSLLIGHGSGCPVLLSFLEKAEPKVDKVILTAGFCEATPDDKNSANMVQKYYDWDKIAATANIFVLINSRDNKLGYDDRFGSFMAEKLDGVLLVEDDNEIECRHSTGLTDFPLLLDVIGNNGPIQY